MKFPIRFDNSKKILSAIIISLLLAASCSSAYPYQDGDFQIWNTNAQEVKIGKATKFTMEEELRYADTASELFYQHYDWGFAWAFDKRFELGLGYRLIFERYKAKWRESDEPYTNLTWKQDIGKFKFEDRNRIEYRHFRYAADHIRYRNKFAIKYPFAFKGMKIIPYISNEIFIASNGQGFNKNRMQSGLEIELNKYVKFDVAYMLQSSRGNSDKWTDSNVLWLKNKISF